MEKHINYYYRHFRCNRFFITTKKIIQNNNNNKKIYNAHIVMNP